MTTMIARKEIIAKRRIAIDKLRSEAHRQIAGNYFDREIDEESGCYELLSPEDVKHCGICALGAMICALYTPQEVSDWVNNQNISALHMLEDILTPWQEDDDEASTPEWSFGTIVFDNDNRNMTFFEIADNLEANIEEGLS